jgi:hypothetical protein
MKRNKRPLKERFRNLKYARKYLAAAKASGDEKTFKYAARVFRALIKGARERELTARHLLIHQELIPHAGRSEMKALQEYMERRGWRSLWGHDNRMYRILREAAERYAAASKQGSPVSKKRKKYRPCPL